jgi:glycerol-3-phosphate acyltransferase PlsY
MSIYWLLLGLTAIVAYLFGSMDTMVLASNFVFHRNLRRLGDHTRFISNFRRLFGIGGFFKLLAVELVKDLIPIIVGSLLLGIRGHADVGRAFAGFVLVLGRLFPVFYGFRGSHATVAMIAAGFAVNTSVGAAAMMAAVGVIALTRYLSLGTLAGAVVYVMVSVLAVDDSLLLRLALFTAGLVFLRHIPSVIRLLRRTEPRLSLKEDITYKLDE